MISVCNIKPQKTETHRTKITVGGNLIDYPAYGSTPTSDLTAITLHVKSDISDVKKRYICMNVKYFYLNKMMDKAEYIMIHITDIDSECMKYLNLQILDIINQTLRHRLRSCFRSNTETPAQIMLPYMVRHTAATTHLMKTIKPPAERSLRPPADVTAPC